MADVLGRIHRFEREIEMAGSQTVESSYGVGVLEPSLPLRHDSNYLLVERLPLGKASGLGLLACLGTNPVGLSSFPIVLSVTLGQPR
jgi:hypothetical protein